LADRENQEKGTSIIATMLENGISILYTENLKDFKKIYRYGCCEGLARN